MMISIMESGYVDTGSPSVGSSRSWKSMEMEIQSLLEKLLDINDSMSRCAASATPATSVTQKLARHRDILHEFTQEFRRIKGNINSMSEHAELLSSVRDDISEYKASGSMSPRMQLLRERAAIHGSIAHEFRRIKGNINSMSEHAELLSSVRDDISEYKASGSMSPRMQLLRERAAIHGSIAHVFLEISPFVNESFIDFHHPHFNAGFTTVQIDDVIGQAQTTRQVLGSQKAMFGDVQGKVKNLSDKFPIIRGLLGSIKRRKSRDTLILAAVIAACTLFLIIYWLSK
ncbi:golgi snap receptor complex member 1-2 [Quercus suber]|uniref:Golgi snap receptor complex member 1-2 n=1 Tax=Quercus suber TaxID=58331 RepID=A0AAW0LHU9_QUESU